MGVKFVLFSLLIYLTSIEARLPPSRVYETEEAPPIVNRPKDENVERRPIDSSSESKPTLNRKPIGVILFRHSPQFDLPRRPLSLFGHHFNDHFQDHFNPLNPRNIYDDRTNRLISLLFGNGFARPPQIDSSETEVLNSSNESSSELDTDYRRDVNPFESIFPNIFTMPKFPIDDKDSEASNEDKTPANFENKEKKIIDIDGRKFVKTVQVKKVKNDFGQFHSIISSYQPFDEKIHDENGNEKIKPDDSSEEKTLEKKGIQTSSSLTTEQISASSTTAATPALEKEESTKSPEIKVVAKESDKLTKLSSENLNKENEISTDNKNLEIKVDQMN